MFDWDDREIVNIIWGEADDHIVPYPEDSNKQRLQFPGTNNNAVIGEVVNCKPSKQKTSASLNNLQGNKSENDEGIFPLSTSKTDHNCVAKKNDPERGAEIPEDQPENGELGEIVGDSWANIGSFDDFDRILNNDDLGHADLDNKDKLWSSSRNVIGGTTKPPSLESTSWGLEGLDNSLSDFKFNTDNLQDENLSFSSGYGKEAKGLLFSQNTSQDQAKADLGSIERTIPESRYSVHKVASNESENEGDWFKGQSKHELGTEKIGDQILFEDIYATWPPPPSPHPQHSNPQFVPEAAKSYASPVISQRNMPPQSLSSEQFSNPYVPALCYGIAQEQYNAGMLTLPSAKISPSEVSASKKLKDALSKPMKMTPQQKIEKLRRRQQMRAVLAIKKQQQQLTLPVSGVHYATSQKSSMEEQLQLKRTDIELEVNLKTPSCDSASRLEQDDSASICGDVDDHNVEDTVLHQLQDIVAKLDGKIGICIRDSLFRLAQSATNRHNASDLSSSYKSQICEPNNAKKEMVNHNRFVKMPSAETQTNHIDRAVAHLLFHRPLNSTREHVRIPESFTSATILPEPEVGASTYLPMRSLPENLETEQSITPPGSNTLPTFIVPPQERSSEERPPRADMGSMDWKLKQDDG